MGGRVAILCGGHSVREHFVGDFLVAFDTVVAVNGAGALFYCDYLVASDRGIVQDKVCAHLWPAPIKAVVTYPAYADRLAKAKVGYLPTPSMADLAEKGLKSCFNFARAIRFSLDYLKASEVTIFGCDFSDEPLDVTGLKGDHYRQRWELEARALREVWDTERIRHVYGRVKPEIVAFVRRELSEFPS